MCISTKGNKLQVYQLDRSSIHLIYEISGHDTFVSIVLIRNQKKNKVNYEKNICLRAWMSAEYWLVQIQVIIRISHRQIPYTKSIH